MRPMPPPTSCGIGHGNGFRENGPHFYGAGTGKMWGGIILGKFINFESFEFRILELYKVIFINKNMSWGNMCLTGDHVMML